MPESKEKFSLKDFLFNEKKVQKMVSGIVSVYPKFKGRAFKKQILNKLPELELLERVYYIRDSLHEYLPQDYRKAVSILVKSLPPEVDPTKLDDDFGQFIYSPYGYFISKYGCTKKDLKFSLHALKECTKRFSVEAPIRFFLNAFPKEALAELQLWTHDAHYHVRRLSSEGTRPMLLWAKKINIPYTQALPLLENLYTDKTRFVTRSVANHLNDISKIDAVAVLKLLKKWKKSKKQNEKEMNYIVQHSLRTLIKDGNKEALAMLGYTTSEIEVKKFSVHTPRVEVGEALEFSFDIVSTSKKPQQLMIDYLLHFKKANGTLAPKTFKIAKKISNRGLQSPYRKNIHSE